MKRLLPLRTIMAPALLLVVLVGCGAVVGEVLANGNFQENRGALGLGVTSYGPWELRQEKRIQIDITPQSVGNCEVVQVRIQPISGKELIVGDGILALNKTISTSYNVNVTGTYRLVLDFQSAPGLFGRLGCSGATYQLKVVSR